MQVTSDRTFTKNHVFAVWGSMSLLKAIQVQLANTKGPCYEKKEIGLIFAKQVLNHPIKLRDFINNSIENKRLF